MTIFAKYKPGDRVVNDEDMAGSVEAVFITVTKGETIIEYTVDYDKGGRDDIEESQVKGGQ